MYLLGIDIGSTASKAVIINENKKIIAKEMVPSGTGKYGPSEVYRRVLEKSGLIKDDLEMILATGYGRFVFEDADNQKSEISCHAKGIYFINPAIRTIVDIGGQDVKVIRINDEGRIINFTMNDKCAAGTGRFLENMAKVLNLNTEDLGDISMKAEHEAEISNTCTVFAESEVISKLANNTPTEDLVAGIHTSVARRVASLAFRNGIVPKVAMSGGVARNKGIVKALSREINQEIFVHEDSQFFGALGAALFALEETMKKNNNEEQ